MMDKPGSKSDSDQAEFIFPADDVTLRQRAEVDELIAQTQVVHDRLNELEAEHAARVAARQKADADLAKKFDLAAAFSRGLSDTQRLAKFRFEEKDFEKTQVQPAQLFDLDQPGRFVDLRPRHIQNFISEIPINNMSYLLNELGFQFDLDERWTESLVKGESSQGVSVVDSKFNFMGSECLVKVFTDRQGVIVALNLKTSGTPEQHNFEVAIINPATLDPINATFEFVTISGVFNHETQAMEISTTVRLKEEAAVQKPNLTSMFTISDGKVERISVNRDKEPINIAKFVLKSVFRGAELVKKSWQRHQRHSSPTSYGRFSDTVFYAAKRLKYNQLDFGIEMAKGLINQARRRFADAANPQIS